MTATWSGHTAVNAIEMQGPKEGEILALTCTPYIRRPSRVTTPKKAGNGCSGEFRESPEESFIGTDPNLSEDYPSTYETLQFEANHYC